MNYKEAFDCGFHDCLEGLMVEANPFSSEDPLFEAYDEGYAAAEHDPLDEGDAVDRAYDQGERLNKGF